MSRTPSGTQISLVFT